MEWSLAAVQDLVSREVPDRDMLVWEGVRKTHGEVASRSAGRPGRGRVPLGYLNSLERTLATFPIVDGVRLAVPGDCAMVDADGSVRMLGRDSMVVNTGGEKVFVEQVEEALRGHPEVEDALVVGRPSDRFGQEVTAIVQLPGGAIVAPNELREFVAKSIARFKAPRAIAFCEVIKRQASGKPDYQWALEAAQGGRERGTMEALIGRPCSSLAGAVRVTTRRVGTSNGGTLNWSERSAIVTGGAGGLGAATVRRLHGLGMPVVVFDRALEAGEALIASLGRGAAVGRRHQQRCGCDGGH